MGDERTFQPNSRLPPSALRASVALARVVRSAGGGVVVRSRAAGHADASRRPSGAPRAASA